MGTPPYAAVSLQRLLEHRSHRIAAVVTRPDARSGRGQKLQPAAVKALAIRHGIEVLDPTTAKDRTFVARLATIAPDVAVVVAYGRFLPRVVLDIPALGCINAHGSLLPAFRGAAPIERAMLAGLDRTGVTIMRINERMDAGDVMLAQSLPITATMTGGELREHMAGLSAELLVRAVDLLASGRAEFTPQDESAASYAPPIGKEDLRIDWTGSAEAIDRQIRAFRPKPAAFTFMGGRRMKVLAADPASNEAVPTGSGATPPWPSQAAPAGGLLAAGDDGLWVSCGSGVLRIHTLQPEGRKPMSAAEYLRGHPNPTGKCFDA